VIRRAVFLLLVLLKILPAQAPDIVSPAPDSLFEKGPVRVIARGEQLRLDGKPVEVERPAGGVVTALVEVGPGSHELTLLTEKGPQKLRFAVGKAGGGKPFREHPPVNNCQTCHVVKGSVWSLQRPSQVALCFPCHNKESFPKSHTHIPGVLADCQLCHNAHGAAAPALLTLSKETACKQCHN